MKVKQGRISLYINSEDKYKNSVVNRIKTHSFKKNSISLTKNFQKSDSRALFDKKFLHECITEILKFLEKSNFDFTFNPRILQNPSTNDFAIIFKFLIQKIDYNYEFTEKFEENVPVILKFLKYPFSLPKSSYSTVANMYTWPILLGCLKWLIELFNYNQEIKSDKKFTNIPKSKKIIWEQLVFAYRIFLLGDEKYKKLYKNIWTIKKNQFSIENKVRSNNKIIFYNLRSKYKLAFQIIFFQIFSVKRLNSFSLITKKILKNFRKSVFFLYKKNLKDVPIKKGIKNNINEISFRKNLISFYIKYNGDILQNRRKTNDFIITYIWKIKIIFFYTELFFLVNSKNSLKIRNLKVSDGFEKNISTMLHLKIINFLIKKKNFEILFTNVVLIFLVKIEKLKFDLKSKIMMNSQKYKDYIENEYKKSNRKRQYFIKNFLLFLCINVFQEKNSQFKNMFWYQDFMMSRLKLSIVFSINLYIKKKINFVKKARKIINHYHVFKKLFFYIKFFLFYFFEFFQNKFLKIYHSKIELKYLLF